jgi:hypothetical protein
MMAFCFGFVLERASGCADDVTIAGDEARLFLEPAGKAAQTRRRGQEATTQIWRLKKFEI